VRAQGKRSQAVKRTRLRQHLVQLHQCCLLGSNSISAFSAARTAEQWRGGKIATCPPARPGQPRAANAPGQRAPALRLDICRFRGFGFGSGAGGGGFY
jgi:hypothetical protein